MNGTGLDGKGSSNSGGGAYMAGLGSMSEDVSARTVSGTSDVLGPPPGHVGCRVPPPYCSTTASIPISTS